MSDRFLQKEFSSWVKTTVALQVAKEGMFGYIKSIMTQLVDKLANICNDEEHRIRFLKKITVDGRVSREHLTKRGGEFKWKISTECRECTDMFDELKDVLDESYKNVHWRCHATGSTISSSVFWWILSKVYIPYEIEDSLGPEEVDPLAVFKLMITCTLFVRVKPGVNSLIDLRNRLMHSKDNMMSEDEMKAAFTNMKDLLRDETVSLTSQKAIAEIEMLEKKELMILDVDKGHNDLVLKALRLKKQCLENDLESERSRGNSTEKYEQMLKATTSEMLKEENHVLGVERRQSELIEKLKADNERLEKESEFMRNEKQRFKALLEASTRKQIEAEKENHEMAAINAACMKKIQTLESKIMQGMDQQEELQTKNFNLQRMVDELVIKTQSNFYDKCLTGMTAGGTAGSIAGLPGIGVGAVIGGSIGASKAVIDSYRK